MNDKYIVYFMSRARKKMISFIEKKLIENNLDGIIPSHGNILTALYENNGKLTMKQIAQITRKDKSTITPLINKLLQLGYITKEKHETDKRSTYILLTSQGYQLKETYEKISSEVSATAYKGFSPEEKAQFLTLLKRLTDNFTSAL